MKQITLRSLPNKVEKAVLDESRKKGLSLNKAVIGLLEQSVGAGGTKKLYYDLDHLSGAWSDDESKAFDRSLEEQRKVDEDLWK